jgi:hypothetical protein
LGQGFEARCRKCRQKFGVSVGGGFTFHLLRCDQCGATKSISFRDIGEPHLRYIKGLAGPYCVATAESDARIQQEYPGEPLSEGEYYLAVEKMAGRCSCGGQFRFDAPVRCPKCHSTSVKMDGPTIMYD